MPLSDSQLTERLTQRLRAADIRHAEVQIAQTDKGIARLKKRRAELVQELNRLQSGTRTHA